MRFTAYISACALIAATRAADLGSVNEVPVEIDIDTEVEADSGLYLEIDADADAEVQAYIEAGLQSGAEALAYAAALTQYQEHLMAQMQNEGSNEDAENFGQIYANAENIFTDFFSSAWKEVNQFYEGVSAKVGTWGEDVKEQFGKMVEEGRNLRVSTISKMISRGIKGMNAFQEIGHEYTDHCSTADEPMNFEDFFKHTTFYNGDGDWQTYEGLHKQLGEEPALDSYLTLRRDARTEDMIEAVAEMHEFMKGVVKHATRQGIQADTFKSNKENPLPQHFYDQVAKNKNAVNPYKKAPAKETSKKKGEK